MSSLLEAKGPLAVVAKKPAGALAALREKQGGVPQQLLDAVKEQQRVRRLLKGALDKGPKSVPELAIACNLPSDVVLWHVMAMRRYGDVVEAGEEGRSPFYAHKGAGRHAAGAGREEP